MRAVDPVSSSTLRRSRCRNATAATSAICAGATALRALTGKPVPVMKARGTILPGPEGLPIFATVHPSYLLRIPDEAGQARAYASFVQDLRAAHAQVM